jgi:carbon monoxide dehydrogenase subunit G
MPTVSKQQDYDVSADEMWGRIGDFHRVSTWLPGVDSQSSEGGDNVRELHLTEGGTVVETLLDEGPHTYSYRIDDSPLPVADYVATISVIERDGGSTVSWTAEFEADGASDAEAVAVIEGIFQGGLDAL